MTGSLSQVVKVKRTGEGTQAYALLHFHARCCVPRRLALALLATASLLYAKAAQLNTSPVAAANARLPGFSSPEIAVANLRQRERALDTFIACPEDEGRIKTSISSAETLLHERQFYQSEDRWEVKDAQRRLADLKRLDSMTSQQRQQLILAKRESDEANRFERTGSPKEAVESKKKALSLLKLAWGGEDAKCAIAMDQLARMYRKADNDVEAEPFLKEALAILKIAFGEQHPVYAESLHNLGSLYLTEKRYPEAEVHFKQAAQIRKSVFGDGNTAYAASISGQAVACQAQRKYEQAEPLFLEAAAIYKSSAGEKHPSYATSLSNLASLYSSEKKYDLTEQLYQQALAIREKALGENTVEYVETLSNLANAYKAGRQPGEAELLYQQLVTLQKKRLGENSPVYASSLNDLALLYDAQARYSEAEPLYLKVLTIRKKTLGEDHPDYATALSNVASLYDSQGRYAEAESLFTKTLQIRRKVLGENALLYAATLNKVGWLYQEQGRYKDAEAVFKQAVKAQDDSTGEKGATYAESIGDLAVAYLKEGKYGEAEPLLLSAVAITKEALGETSPRYGTRLNDLASWYETEGEYERAESLYRQSLVIQRASLGEFAPAVARRIRNLANVYEEQGRFAEAEPLLKQALEIRKKDFGEEHPLYAASLGDLASEYEAQGRRAEAEPLFRKSLAIQKLALGEDHPEYARTLSHLAKIYQAEGRSSDAEPLYRQALAIRRKALGENHLAYASSLGDLASIYEARGQYDQAEALYKQGLEIRKTAIGEDHPLYATSLLNLAGVYEAQGQFANAEPFYRQAVAIRKKALGQDHPDYAHSLGYLSINLAATEHWQEAAQLQLEAAQIRWKHLVNNLGAFSPSQQTQWLKAGSPNEANLLLGLVFSGHASGEQGMQAVLWRKELGVEALRQQSSALRSAVVLGDPTWRKGWRQLEDSRREYVALGLGHSTGGTSSQTDSEVITSFRLELKQQIDDQEAKLRQSNPAYAEMARLQDVRVQDVRHALLPGQALVEYVRYRPIDFRGRGATAYYGALIVRGGKSDIQAVELGRSAEIDSLIGQYRDQMGAVTKRFEISPSRNQLHASESKLGAISSQIRKKIWEPLEVAFQGAKRIYVAPDGDLSLMPFEVLADKRPDGGWHYLAEDNELVYVNTGRDLARLALKVAKEPSRPQVLDKERAVLVGAPAFGASALELAAASGTKQNGRPRASQASEDYPSSLGNNGSLGPGSPPSGPLEELPAAFSEVPELRGFTSTIGQSLAKHGWQVQKLEGLAASKRAVLTLEHPDLLQFASHGVFVRTGPSTALENSADSSEGDDALLRSAIILAGYNHRMQGDHVFYRIGNELLSADAIRTRGLKQDELADKRVDVGDGILTAYEVTGMDLEGTRLVNLTACETGLGTVTAEGVAGLREGFLLAGARAVTMSMWQVPADEVTRQMLTFYDRWLNDGSGGDKSTNLYQAFHQSQLAALKRTRQVHGSGHPFYWAGTIYAGDPGDLPLPDSAK